MIVVVVIVAVVSSSSAAVHRIMQEEFQYPSAKDVIHKTLL